MTDPQKLRPPQILFMLLISAGLLQFSLTPDSIVPDWGHLAGAGLFFTGMVIMSVARMQFKKHGTPVRHSETPVKLVMDGLFAYTRNPMYAGGLIMCSGLAFWVGTWPFFLVPAVMFLIIDRVFIPWEEKLMTELFGSQYRDYMKRHRRWI